MYTVTKYPQGTFSWADMNSTDPEKVKPFYKNLFGWGNEDLPLGEGMQYTMFKMDNRDVTGLGPMMQEMQDQGIPSHWNSYISVDDVDAIVKKASKHGGTVIAEPFDVFDSGRMAVVQDPTGAVISFWQPNKHIGSGVVNKPGAVLWNELATRDVEKAKDFYSKVVGWEYKTDERNYTMIVNKGRMNGGIMEMDENFGDMPPVWSIYFNIEDLDKALKDVEKLGGKIMMGKTSAGEVGDFAVVADPTGAVFNIMQANEVEAWVE